MFKRFFDQLGTRLSDAGPEILTGIGVFLAFWLAAVIAGVVIGVLRKKSKFQSDIFYLLARIARMILVVIGIVSGLGTMGVNVSAMVASLGLTGFALGFALKDALSNVLAGVLVLVYQPFAVGTKIKVMGYEGEVERIDLRYTTLKTETRRILIPNANLFNNPVEIVQAAQHPVI